MNILTGIKPTGRPHLGNYVGAIAPALEFQSFPHHQCTYFIADYHALVNHPSPQEMRSQTMDVALTWLACGLDPDQSVLYRQSDIAEIFELQWILTCFTAKGVLNRAHAYKAQVEKQHQNTSLLNPQSHIDDAITMGLFQYPVLMAADILVASPDLIPVGADQKQHVEIARDLAAKLHHHYQCDVFTIPEITITKPSTTSGTLVGLDGRKMSKSYNNHIPLFSGPAELKKMIRKIPTDSSASSDPKPTSGILYELAQAFYSPEHMKVITEQYQAGIGWGELKDQLAEQINTLFENSTERYHTLKDRPQYIEDILAHGAQKMRAKAKTLLDEIRSIIGISKSVPASTSSQI